jgi:hypothetical protein
LTYCPFSFVFKKIIALDSEAVKDPHQRDELLRRHIDRLNANPQYQRAKKYFIPENNLAMEAAHLETTVNAYPDITTYWEKPGVKPGVNKTNATTRNYQFLMSNTLRHRCLLFAQNIYTVSRKRNSDMILAMLRDQFERYHEERKEAKDVFGRDRVTLTGKSGDKQDDLLIATLQCLYWARAIVRDPSLPT